VDRSDRAEVRPKGRDRTAGLLRGAPGSSAGSPAAQERAAIAATASCSRGSAALSRQWNKLPAHGSAPERSRTTVRLAVAQVRGGAGGPGRRAQRPILVSVLRRFVIQLSGRLAGRAIQLGSRRRCGRHTRNYGRFSPCCDFRSCFPVNPRFLLEKYIKPLIYFVFLPTWAKPARRLRNSPLHRAFICPTIAILATEC
jgi:hypothetical protein